MEKLDLLAALTFAPLLGAIFIMLIDRSKVGDYKAILARDLTLMVMIGELILCALLIFHFNNATDVEVAQDWIEDYKIYFMIDADGLSLSMIVLTVILMPIALLCSWHTCEKRGFIYPFALLTLQGFLIGVFVAQDLLMFYFFFECTLIPMFALITMWGGEDRFYAGYKFFLYTLFGSLFMLAGIAYIYYSAGTTKLSALYEIVPSYSLSIQNILWLSFFLSFAIKVPMWPLHTWLPDAHVQAPTSGSVILAGVLLKLGAYGFLRLSLPLFPVASIYFADFIYVLSIIAVIYISLVALMQTDMKKMVAYSSIAHMGYVTAGIFSMDRQGLEGAIIQMISHGFISAGLFICVGVLYDRMHTKEIAVYGGLAEKMPNFAFCLMVLMLGSVGLPGTSGFPGEFLVLLSAFSTYYLYGILMATGVILGAAYMLWLYARIAFGEIKNPKLHDIKDLNFVEKISLIPILIAVLGIGIYPNVITFWTDGFVQKILDNVTMAEAFIK